MQLDDSYEGIYRQARELADLGEPELALDAYERIFNKLGKLSPETRARHQRLKELFVMASMEMVMLLEQMRDYDRILGLMERLLDIEPDGQFGWRHQRARCLIQRGEVDQALAELHALADEKPDNSLVHMTLGDGYLEKKAYTEAADHFRRAVESTDETENKRVKATGYIGLSRAYALAGHPDEANEAWQAAIALDSSLVYTISWLYRAHLGQGRTREARALMTHDDDAARRGYFSGMADYVEGNVDVAQRRWRKVFALEVDEESESLQYWAEAGLRLGQAVEVVAALGPLLADDALNPREIMLLGVGLAMVGDKDQAETLFSAARQTLLPRGLDQLPEEFWELMNQLLEDEETKGELRHHFEGGEQQMVGAGAEDVSREDTSTEEPAKAPSESGE